MSPQRKNAPPPSPLLAIGHYHQPAGRHPTPILLQDDIQIIELVTYGRGWVLLEGGHWQEVLPGALLWHVRGDQTIGRSDFKNPYHCLAVRFRAKPSRGRPAPRLSHWGDLAAVRTFTNEIVSAYAMERASAAASFDYVLSRIRFQIELHENQSSSQSLPQQLQRVLRHVEAHYGEPLPLKELAAVAEWSVPQLHKSFREHLAQSPHQWLLIRRIQAARERLANSNQPIKSIAIDCGFYSAAAFCAHFKRATGTTPNAYRVQMTQS